MRIKLTLARSSGTQDDIIVTTDAGATLSEVAETIAQVDPRSDLPEGASRTPLTLRTTVPGNPEWILLPPDAPIGEEWVGSGSHIALADSEVYLTESSSGSRAAVAVVHVLDGPDAGSQFPLPPGSYIIGRSPDSDIALSDSQVSKSHVRLEVSDTVDVIDLGSANGVVVDGGFVSRLRVEKSSVIEIGGTQLRITCLEEVADSATTPRTGPVIFTRSPRVEPRYKGQEFAAPDVPSESDENPFPWLAMLAPALLGLSMFLITQRPASLLFVLMSPLMLVGNFLMNKSREKKKQEKKISRFEDRLQSLGVQLAEEQVREVNVRLSEAPATAEVLEAVTQRSPMMWTRRPEHWSFLNVRLGLGRMVSRNNVDPGKRGELMPEFQQKLDDTIATFKYIDAVPVVDNLYDSGALGIAGPNTEVAKAANSTLIQVTGLHSPAELAVCALVSSQWSAELEWLKWVPHTSSPQSPITVGHLADSASSAATLLGALEELIQARTKLNSDATRRGAIEQREAALERGGEVGSSNKDDGTDSPIPAIVVVISHDVDVDKSRLIQLAERGPDAGIFPIWLGPTVSDLPAACRTFLEVDASRGIFQASFVRLGEVVDSLQVEGVDFSAAMDFARDISPVVDGGARVEDSSDIPRNVSMVSLLGHDLIETSDAVIDRWNQNSSIHDRSGAPPRIRKAGHLRATVGSTGVGTMHLDLRSQGPHALVGGTTGSGKSEFLQAWVLGMAAEYSPDRVTFLFIDYKGGSAFADCVELPHCVGLVTDLSPHLVRRALTSLRAELHFREHLLNRKKAKDLIELEKRGDPECPPALVLVIDEFAALVGEVPEFVDGVVDIAQRGRSLGIHLIMATQRPAGVIKDNLRANTNLRVALRMADESDSSDVVGTKDAAHFDPSIPGRAIAKTGPGRLQGFQSAYAGGWTSRTPERPGVSIGELRFGGELPWELPADVSPEEKDLGPTDQQLLVASIVSAVKTATIPEPRRPWLDELQSSYALEKFQPKSGSRLVIGLADLPQRQAQEPVYFNPDVDGNIAIFGTGGSGKSTTLRTLACAASLSAKKEPVVIYGLDFAAGSLRMLEALPTVASVITSDDSERIIRLFRELKNEIENRSRTFAEVNASSVSDFRKITGKTEIPRILLLIDGFPSFRDEWEVASGRSAWYDVFKSVLSDGRQLGVHVAFSADRSGAVPSSISSSVQRRVIHRLSDETGYTMLDVPGDILSSASPAGRAVFEGEETQVCVLGGSSSVTEQAEAIAKLGTALLDTGVEKAQPIRSLPKEYFSSTLPVIVGTEPSLGIGEEELEAIGFDPAGTFLLAGPPASGRTNALMAIVASLRKFDESAELYYIGNARSPVPSIPGWKKSVTSIDDAAELAKQLTTMVADTKYKKRIAIFVENLSDYLQSPADGPLVELIKSIKRSDHFLLADSETSSWNASWPLFAEIKNARRGLLMQPDAMEGELILKTPIPRSNRSEFPPGRGVYIARGKNQKVQIPLAD